MHRGFGGGDASSLGAVFGTVAGLMAPGVGAAGVASRRKGQGTPSA